MNCFLKVSKSKRKKNFIFGGAGLELVNFFLQRISMKKIYFFHCVLFLFSGGRGERSKVCEYSLRRIQI